MNLFRVMLNALYQGEKLTHLETWKHVAGASAALVAVLSAVVPFLPFVVATEQVQAISDGIATVGSLLVVYLNYATSDKVGLPPPSGSAPQIE